MFYCIIDEGKNQRLARLVPVGSLHTLPCPCGLWPVCTLCPCPCGLWPAALASSHPEMSSWFTTRLAVPICVWRVRAHPATEERPVRGWPHPVLFVGKRGSGSPYPVPRKKQIGNGMNGYKNYCLTSEVFRVLFLSLVIFCDQKYIIRT